MKTSEDNNTNYYYGQLAKVITTGEYLPKIQVRDEEGNSTKWMNLNNEYIDEVVYWLELLREENKDK